MLFSHSGILAKVINKRWDSGPKYDFLLNPLPVTHRQSRLLQRAKIKKIMLAAFPSSVVVQYQNSKSDKYYILIELGPPMWETSTRISYFYAPTDSGYKFHKTRIENCLPIGFGLGFLLIRNPQL